MRVETLSLPEAAAQVVFPGFAFDQHDPLIARKLAKAGVGGFCLYRGNASRVPEFVNELQDLAKIPLLFCADMEEGAGQQFEGATRLPTLMALGAAASPELARLHGLVTAKECRALGIPWNLAPVVDLNSNPENPIINIRAFGDKPEKVIPLAREWLRGLHDGGALGCLKHFPGHGDVSADSHAELPVVSHSKERLDQIELAPFSALASAADAVMVAHLRADAWDPERPASLSPTLIRKVLRERIGFQGLVVTDALMMDALVPFGDPGALAVAAAQAGADVLLYPRDPRGAIDALVHAVQSGSLPEADLRASAGRILQAKEKVGLFADRRVSPERAAAVVGSKEHAEEARRIARETIREVRDPGHLLPLRQISAVSLRNELDEAKLEPFLSVLKPHLSPTASAPVVIPVLARPRAWGGQEAIRPSLPREAKGRIVWVSLGSPYIGRDLPLDATFVCAYSDCPASQQAAALALLGRIPFRGSLPVAL